MSASSNIAARDSIFGNIRRRPAGSAGHGAASEDRHAPARARLEDHPASTIPARSQLPGDEKVELFVAMAREAAADVKPLDDLADLGRELQTLAQEISLAGLACTDPELLPLLHGLEAPPEVLPRPAQDGDDASLVEAFCGIAETGTLMLFSGQDRPTGQHFLPETHIVLLRRSGILGAYEEAWERLRARGEGMPRSLNLITGPSRSADIEQKLQMGAHGPRRLVILLLND